MSLFTRRSSDVGEIFRNDPQLQQFVLNGVTSTGRVLGTGSYGSVVEVNYQHLVCAGKKLHEALFYIRNEGMAEMVHRYLQECQLMSSLHHPNITQFLGVCFLPGTQLPLLVMERLETSLDDLLEHMPNLPLSLKRSVLEDVASGLLYLHRMLPPVIHRDLTSKNVLLTSSLVAKITDMGNSRIVDVRPGEMARTLSSLPGTLVYMPPEALDDRHHYGPSLDVFSFGHLALYTLTQIFPGNLLASTFHNPDNPEAIQARNEVERRDQYIQLLEAQVGQLHPAFVQLVKQCLHNVPNLRPSTEELLTRLQGMREAVEGKYGGPIKLDLIRVRLAKELEIKERRIEELTQLQERQETELELCRRNVESLQSEIEAKDGEQRALENQVEIRDQQIKNLQAHYTGLVEAKEEENVSLRQQLQRIQIKLTKEIQSKGVEIEELREQLKELKGLQQPALAEKVSKKHSFQFTWRRGPDAPFGMGGCVQSVLVQGKVYVGGGDTPRRDNRYCVMEYDPCSGWLRLPQYETTGFAMAAVDNFLVLVGSSNNHIKLGVWRPEDKEWTHPYPEMSILRYAKSASSYGQWLVVVGAGPETDQSSIHMLNTITKCWEQSPLLLPVSLSFGIKTAIVNDTLYFMGGYSDKVFSVSLLNLIHDKVITTWKELPELQFKDACPLSIDGNLLAVGGMDRLKAVTAIQLFIPDKNEWVKIGDLPLPRSSCTCTLISDREILVAGGDFGYKSMIQRVDSGFLL